MAKVKVGYAKCPCCPQQFNRVVWLLDHMKVLHPKAYEFHMKKGDKEVLV